MYATVQSDGEVTIPMEILDKTGIRPGDEIEFVERDGAIVIRRVPGSAAGGVSR